MLQTEPTARSFCSTSAKDFSGSASQRLDADAYEGEFKNGQPHGKTTARMENGMTIDGEWKEGKPWNCEVAVNGKIACVFKDGKQAKPPAEA